MGALRNNSTASICNGKFWSDFCASGSAAIRHIGLPAAINLPDWDGNYILFVFQYRTYFCRAKNLPSFTHPSRSSPSQTNEHSSRQIMIRPTAFFRQAERLVNRNPELFGPGPLARRPAGGIGAMPPLRGLIVCASQGMAVALLGGLAYNVLIGNPELKKIEDYYKENPPR
jgi:hypothetical protein